MAGKKSGSEQAGKGEKLLKSGVPASVGKRTQFKKGQSGNPAGKPPGTLSLSTHIQNLLNDPDFDAWVFNGRAYEEYKGAPMRAVIKAQAVKAMTGDTKAADWLAKYGYGTKIEVSGPEGQPVVALVEFMDAAKPKRRKD